MAPGRSRVVTGRAHLLAWKTHTRGAHHIPIVDYSSPLETVDRRSYVKSGTPLAKAELHLIDPRTGGARPVRLSFEDAYGWVAAWRKDVAEALVLRLSRDGKRLELFGVDPGTGDARLIVSETRPESFVGDLGFWSGGWSTQLALLPDGFLWASERDGWRHLYRYGFDGRLRGQVTRGAFPVHEVAAVDSAGRNALVLASADPGRPYDRRPYRLSIGDGKLVPLSTSPGVHRLTASPSGRYFNDTHSTREQASVREVVEAASGRSVPYAAFDDAEMGRRGFRPPEAFEAVAADGVTRLYGVLYRPYDFDPAKRYPVIDYVYGGPFTTVVPWSYLGTADSITAGALAQAGFVVMLVDGRGTPDRGKAFQDATYGRIGQTEIADQVAALRQAAATRPWMDVERAGIYGHSWGGYFALRGMLTAPEVFKAGYAGAPGALTEDAVVNEPNMGLPSQNPAGYAAGANEPLAGGLRGALKMMHGTSDDQAPISTTLRMAQALVEAGKRFDLLIMPGQGHSPEGEQRFYYLEDVARFFVEHLGAPEPASTSALEVSRGR